VIIVEFPLLLLEVLASGTESYFFYDNHLEGEYDLSKVLADATANNASQEYSAGLRDRLSRLT
jgi:ATP-dependent Lon protease